MPRSLSHLRIAGGAVIAAVALGACGSGSSTSSTGSSSDAHPTQAQIQRAEADAVRFSGCMRSHGVPDFPDPTNPHQFKSTLADTHSPAFMSAEATCRHLLPGLGSHQQSPSPSHAQIAAELAFARCIRAHGFPSFPDPTSSGGLTHEMLAAAGINVHLRAVVQAADACVGVTHGLLTRADVARFAAGQ
jgi:hypothetical protein